MFDGGRLDDAIVQLRAAAWLDEAAPLPHHDLANVYYAKGRLNAALREEAEAVRRAPRVELYRRNLEALRAATAH